MSKYHELLTECGQLTAPRCVSFFIDGIDDLDSGHQATTLSWLPEKIPQVCGGQWSLCCWQSNDIGPLTEIVDQCDVITLVYSFSLCWFSAA